MPMSRGWIYVFDLAPGCPDSGHVRNSGAGPARGGRQDGVDRGSCRAPWPDGPVIAAAHSVQTSAKRLSGADQIVEVIALSLLSGAPFGTGYPRRLRRR